MVFYDEDNLVIVNMHDGFLWRIPVMIRSTDIYYAGRLAMSH